MSIMDEANRGIVGIDEDLNVFGGYDEALFLAHTTGEWLDVVDREDFRPLSAEERRALADEMIARWQRYKDATPSF